MTLGFSRQMVETGTYVLSTLLLLSCSKNEDFTLCPDTYDHGQISGDFEGPKHLIFDDIHQYILTNAHKDSLILKRTSFNDHIWPDSVRVACAGNSMDSIDVTYLHRVYSVIYRIDSLFIGFAYHQSAKSSSIYQTGDPSTLFVDENITYQRSRITPNSLESCYQHFILRNYSEVDQEPDFYDSLEIDGKWFHHVYAEEDCNHGEDAFYTSPSEGFIALRYRGDLWVNRK